MNEPSTASSDGLLEAAGQSGAPADRRQASRRRIRRDRRRGIKRSVGVDISPTGICVAILEQSTGKAELITDRIEFNRESGPPRGDWTDGTLTNALTELAVRHSLGGQAVAVSFGGTPCVTRVVAGDNHEVDNEITELTGRTQRYIGMGIGEKVSCQTVNRIDAKRKRVCVTIAMRAVVESVTSAIAEVGLRLVRMEHTMLVLCRILDRSQIDANEPVLFVINEMDRIDLGISYQGRLILDYRPAMPDRSETFDSVVKRHFKCLRRYIQAQIPGSGGRLSSIYVTGNLTREIAQQSELDSETGLKICEFPFASICDELTIEGDTPPHAGLLSAIALAKGTGDSTDKETNDLSTVLHTRNNIKWLALLKLGWPVAIAASIAMALFLFGSRAQRSNEAAIHQIELLAQQKTEGTRLRREYSQQMRRAQQVDALAAKIRKPQWTQLVLEAGSILPKAAWLESLLITQDQTISIAGSSLDNESVFEYLDRLRRSAKFDHVALESTSTSRGSAGPEYHFEISAKWMYSVETAIAGPMNEVALNVE